MLETLDIRKTGLASASSLKNREIAADRALIERVIGNDVKAHEEFVTRYSRLIYWTLHRNGLSQEESEDIFGQIFLHLWDRNYYRLRQWKPTFRFCTFLVVVVEHLIADYLYQQSRSNTVCLDDVTDVGAPLSISFAHLMYTRQQVEIINREIVNLSPRDAEILLRRYHLEQSYLELAQALHVSVRAVGVYLQRAEKRLQKKLLQQYPDIFADESVSG